MEAAARESQECEMKHYKSPFWPPSKKSTPSLPEQMLPRQYSRRQYSPGNVSLSISLTLLSLLLLLQTSPRVSSSLGGYRIGNERKPHSFWGNGKLFKRCEARFHFQKTCSSAQHASSNGSKEGEEEGHDVRLTTERQSRRAAMRRELRCPEGKNLPIVIEVSRFGEGSVSQGQASLMPHVRVKEVFVAKTFAVLMRHPWYFVVGFSRETCYRFFSAERVSFESCENLRKHLAADLQRHFPLPLCSIVSEYVGVSGEAVFSRNCLFDLPQGVVQDKATSRVTPLRDATLRDVGVQATRQEGRDDRVKKQTKLRKLEKALAHKIERGQAMNKKQQQPTSESTTTPTSSEVVYA